LTHYLVWLVKFCLTKLKQRPNNTCFYVTGPGACTKPASCSAKLGKSVLVQLGGTLAPNPGICYANAGRAQLHFAGTTFRLPRRGTKKGLGRNYVPVCPVGAKTAKLAALAVCTHSAGRRRCQFRRLGRPRHPAVLAPTGLKTRQTSAVVKASRG
jgi:hypothetical protein